MHEPLLFQEHAGLKQAIFFNDTDSTKISKESEIVIYKLRFVPLSIHQDLASKLILPAYVILTHAMFFTERESQEVFSKLEVRHSFARVSQRYKRAPSRRRFHSQGKIATAA